MDVIIREQRGHLPDAHAGRSQQFRDLQDDLQSHAQSQSPYHEKAQSVQAE